MTYLGTRPPTVDEWDKYELHNKMNAFTTIIVAVIPIAVALVNWDTERRESSASKGNTIRGKSVAVCYCFSGLSI